MDGTAQIKWGGSDDIGVMDSSHIDQDGEVDENMDLEHVNRELEPPLKLQQGADIIHGKRQKLVGKKTHLTMTKSCSRENEVEWRG